MREPTRPFAAYRMRSLMFSELNTSLFEYAAAVDCAERCITISRQQQQPHRRRRRRLRRRLGDHELEHNKLSFRVCTAANSAQCIGEGDGVKLFYYGFRTKVNPVIPRQGTTLVLISDATDSSFLLRFFFFSVLFPVFSRANGSEKK